MSAIPAFTPLAGPVILLPDSFQPGTPVMMGEPVFERPETGWDTMRARYMLQANTRETLHADIETAFPRGGLVPGTELPARLFWCGIPEAKAIAGNFYEVTVTAKGMLAERGYKVSGSAVGSAQSMTDFSDEDSIVHAKASIVTAEPTLLVEYLAAYENTAQDEEFFTVRVGQQVGTDEDPSLGPPEWLAPREPPTPWAWISDPTWHYPNHWVLMACDFELLPNVIRNGIALIRDRWQYIRPLTP
jgi:hypothetical protein